MKAFPFLNKRFGRISMTILVIMVLISTLLPTLNQVTAEEPENWVMFSTDGSPQPMAVSSNVVVKTWGSLENPLFEAVNANANDLGNLLVYRHEIPAGESDPVVIEANWHEDAGSFWTNINKDMSYLHGNIEYAAFNISGGYTIQLEGWWWMQYEVQGVLVNGWFLDRPCVNIQTVEGGFLANSVTDWNQLYEGFILEYWRDGSTTQNDSHKWITNTLPFGTFTAPTAFLPYTVTAQLKGVEVFVHPCSENSADANSPLMVGSDPKVFIPRPPVLYVSGGYRDMTINTTGIINEADLQGLIAIHANGVPIIYTWQQLRTNPVSGTIIVNTSLMASGWVTLTGNWNPEAAYYTQNHTVTTDGIWVKVDFQSWRANALLLEYGGDNRSAVNIVARNIAEMPSNTFYVKLKDQTGLRVVTVAWQDNVTSYSTTINMTIDELGVEYVEWAGGEHTAFASGQYQLISGSDTRVRLLPYVYNVYLPITMNNARNGRFGVLIQAIP